MGRANWKRHLEGWQAGALVLLIAGSAIFLVTPRVVAPTWLPHPVIDAAALAPLTEADTRRVQQLEQKPLDVDVRHLGREMRRYNRAAAADDEQALVQARSRVVKAARRAHAYSVEQTLSLRAYQMQRFRDELKRWQRSGVVSSELEALGGDFLAVLLRNHWCRGQNRELVLPDRVLRVLFKKRWNDISGLSVGEYALSLDEDRVRLGFLIQHPFRSRGLPLVSSVALAKRRADQNRLRTIDRLADRDPSYPSRLARGMVLQRMGNFVMASAAFRQHLESRPDGPYALQARNFLKTSLDLARVSGY